MSAWSIGWTASNIPAFRSNVASTMRLLRNQSSHRSASQEASVTATLECTGASRSCAWVGSVATIRRHVAASCWKLRRSSVRREVPVRSALPDLACAPAAHPREPRVSRAHTATPRSPARRTFNRERNPRGRDELRGNDPDRVTGVPGDRRDAPSLVEHHCAGVRLVHRSGAAQRLPSRRAVDQRTVERDVDLGAVQVRLGQVRAPFREALPVVPDDPPVRIRSPRRPAGMPITGGCQIKTWSTRCRAGPAGGTTSPSHATSRSRPSGSRSRKLKFHAPGRASITVAAAFPELEAQTSVVTGFPRSAAEAGRPAGRRARGSGPWHWTDTQQARRQMPGRESRAPSATGP